MAVSNKKQPTKSEDPRRSAPAVKEERGLDMDEADFLRGDKLEETEVAEDSELDEDEGLESSELDEEELDPFKDKWEE